MMRLYVRECLEPGCQTSMDNWRQCPVKGCPMEICFCNEHGGDDRAVARMREHIQAHVQALALDHLKQEHSK